MTVIKQQKSLLFRPECSPSKCCIELIRVRNILTKLHPADHDRFGTYTNFVDSSSILILNF